MKKYNISKDIIDNIPSKEGEDSDFKKYLKDGKSTTWGLIVNETMSYVTQINSKGKFYGGLMPEPYSLFLSNSKNINLEILETERKFKLNVQTKLKPSENFELEILNNETYEKYITSKISSVIFLIMSIESFINNIIPNDIKIERKNNVDTKTEIEKKYTLKEKFRDVIPIFKEVNNPKEYQESYSLILQLSRIRNSFIHLKTSTIENKFDPYLDHFTKLVTMNLDKEYKNIENLIGIINRMEYVC